MANNTFTNVSGGAWSLDTNWSLDAIPSSSDQVSFASGIYTSLVDGGPWTIQSLNVNVTTVTLEVSVDLTVTGSAGNSGDIVVDPGAVLTLGSLVANSSTISVNGTLIVEDNLKPKAGGGSIIATGLVDLNGTGSGDFSVTGGTLEIGSSYAGNDTIELADGVLWLAGKLGNATFTLDTNSTDEAYFDSPKSTITNSFSGGSAGDRIGIEGVTINSDSYTGTTLTLNTSGGTFTFTDVSLTPGITLGATGTTTFNGNTYGYVELACFAAGTLIDTPNGPVTIESLREGTPLIMASGAVRPVRWIGWRRLDFRRHPRPSMVQPIRIRSGAIGNGMPRRDLFLSPDHAILVDGVLIPVRLLVNGATISREITCRSITYYHVELETHDVMLAEGLAAESYLDTGNRGIFENAKLPLTLYPNLSEGEGHLRRETGSCLELVSDPDHVRPIWQTLADRSQQLGLPLPVPPITTDPAVSLELDGRRIEPVFTCEGRCVFVLRKTGVFARLLSRATAPCDLTPWIEDQRVLGIMVRRLILRRNEDLMTIPLDHPGLMNGWWALEGDTHCAWRWTDGAAELVLPPGGPAILEVCFGQLESYRCAGRVVADGVVGSAYSGGPLAAVG